MNRKFLSLVLSISLLGLNTIPAFAVHSEHSKNNKKVIKSQVTEYKFTDVNLEWWKNYNDEYLEGYIVKAIDNNQDLKIATLKVEEARQYVKLQFANELPNVSLGASEFLYKAPYAGVLGNELFSGRNSESTFGMPIMMNYELDLFRKNHDKTKSAKKMQEVAKFQERAAYLSVASAVGGAYFSIVKLDKLVDIQNDIIADRKQIFELMKMRNVEGITSTADLTRAEKSYVMAQADLINLKKAREIMLNELAVLIGESPNNLSELKRISYDELAYRKEIPKEISSEIIDQRPDYLAAEKQVEKAGIDVRIAKKEFLPKFDIMGLMFFTADSLGTQFSWTNAIAALGGQAMLPIFTGGKLKANLRLSKNKYEQILQNYHKTNLTAIKEVNNSLSTLKLDDEKYRKNLKSYNMQKADYKYMQIRYDQGVMSKLDLIQQKETLLVMNQMVVSSKTDCYIDQISLYKAVGGKL